MATKSSKSKESSSKSTTSASKTKSSISSSVSSASSAASKAASSIGKTTYSGGYSETTKKNADGSTTSTASRPQDGASGSVKNSDGSTTTYNGKGGYTTTDSNGRTTGGGVVGSENWSAGGGNIGDLSQTNKDLYFGGGSGSARDNSVAALSGDMGALGGFANEQDLYNRLLGPQASLKLTEDEKRQMYNDYLDSANAQLNPLRDNYNAFLETLNQQQKADGEFLDNAYNKNSTDMWGNQFAQNGQLQQQMADRGMSNTGISSDALVRQQMAGNSELQNLFINAQGQKSDMNKQYNDQRFTINSTLAELSPESMAAKNLDAYVGGYAEQQNIANQNQQKTLLEMYNTLLGNNTSRVNNVNDNSAKVQMNENDNYASMVNTAGTNQANLDKANLESYTTLTKTDMENQVKIAVEGGKLVLAQDIARTQATGTVYIGGKQLLRNGKPIPTLEFMKLSEENRHNIATENNVKNGDYLDYVASMDSNNAKREGDKLDYTVGMDANEVKREDIAARVEIAAKKIQLGYDNLEKDYFVAQGKMDEAAASLAMTARNAGNKEAQTAIKTVQAKIDAVKAQIKKGKPTKEQKKVLEGLLGELDKIGKGISETGPAVTESTSSNVDLNSLIP